MSSSRATLMQVAERAGGSLASAARALNGTGASRAMDERGCATDRLGRAAAGLGYVTAGWDSDSAAVTGDTGSAAVTPGGVGGRAVSPAAGGDA